VLQFAKLARFHSQNFIATKVSAISCVKKHYIMWIVKFRPNKVKKYNNARIYHKKIDRPINEKRYNINKSLIR